MDVGWFTTTNLLRRLLKSPDAEPHVRVPSAESGAPTDPYTQSLGTNMQLPENEHGHDYYVGDIHGELGLLQVSLDEVGFVYGRDRLISVGDLISRGPDSLGVVELFLNEPGFYFTPGNHEVMLLNVVTRADEERRWDWELRYGSWFSDISVDQQNRVVEFLSAAPLAIEVGQRAGLPIGVTHADWPSDKPFGTELDMEVAVELAFSEPTSYDAPPEQIATWSRLRADGMRRIKIDPNAKATSRKDARIAIASTEPVSGVRELIVGHNPQKGRQPAAIANVLFLDSAVTARNGALTLYRPDLMQCYVRPKRAARKEPAWIDRPCAIEAPGWSSRTTHSQGTIPRGPAG